MKVLLTGALGNVGEYTLKSLLDEGHLVVAFDLPTKEARRRAAKLSARATVAWGDITNRSSIRDALDGVDAVIHLAGMVPPAANEKSDIAARVNVGGTKTLIEAMQASPTARRLVFASSIGVFGDIQDRVPPLRADTPVSPTDEYGCQKVACEQAIKSSTLRWTILRLGAAVPTRVLGSHYDPRAGFDISADARIEFIHPADAGLAFARAAACDEAIGKVLYVGGGKRCQMIALPFYNTLMDPIGIGPVPVEAFVKDVRARFPGDWMDTEESQRLLQYQTRGLDELKEDLKNGLGALVPLVRMLRPIATWFYVRSSPYLKANRKKALAATAMWMAGLGASPDGVHAAEEADVQPATYVAIDVPQAPEPTPAADAEEPAPLMAEVVVMAQRREENASPAVRSMSREGIRLDERIHVLLE